jgi:hypothetical protein
LKAPREGLSLQEQVAYLLRRDQETQQRLNAAETEQASHPARWGRDIEEARHALEQRIERRLEDARDVYIRRRLLGVVLLLFGVPILAAANLI